MDTEDEASQALVDAVGPLYDSAGLQRWLELTEDEVVDLVQSGQLLAVTTQDGISLFPALQFGQVRALVPRLGEVVGRLRSTLDDWSIALWMLYEDPQYGVNAFERLRSGDYEGVVRDAERQAEILRH